MRKIIVSEMVTADGFFAGPKGEIDWHTVDDAFQAFAIAQLEGASTLLFGRVTYDLMAGYWPLEEIKKEDPIVAAKMNALEKVVLSKTRDSLEWQNSRVLGTLDRASIEALKQAPGKDILVFGSGTVVSALADMGLVDEYRFFVSPIALGKGRTLFEGCRSRVALELVEAKPIGKNALLRLRHAKK